jgi:hypothetical protein
MAAARSLRADTPNGCCTDKRNELAPLHEPPRSPTLTPYHIETGGIVRHSEMTCSTSDLGQKRTWRDQIAMSALPPIADIPRRNHDVRFGPKADIMRIRRSLN